jgi:tetraacyldisaccharide 4'-kinase
MIKLATPRWWYVRKGAPAPVVRALLKPFSWIWAAEAARRIARASPVDCDAPVICVGNLTVGGSGKTPIVMALLDRLRAKGVEAHGLSRGYGGRLKGPVRVDPALYTAADVGDEPLMLAEHAPVWVARDRAEGARAAVAGGAELVVLDDGHQNPTLKKTLSLIVVDGDTRGGAWPFGDESVFPAGPLRESLAVGLARADAVILLLPAAPFAPDPELLALFGDLPVLLARLSPSGPTVEGPQLGFAGVAKPWKVEQSMKAAGVDLVEFVPFPDHAPFKAEDLRFLADRAAVFRAGLITTEKDWARLPPDWRARVRAWPVRAVFDDPAALNRLLSPLVASVTVP